jgi:hypothetical protein
MEVPCSSAKSILTYDVTRGKKRQKTINLMNIRHDSLKTYMQIVYVYVPDWPTGVYVFFRSNL